MEVLKKNYRRYVIYIIYTAMWYMVHMMCRRYGDDEILRQALVFGSVSEFFEYYFNFISTWSSRFVIDFFGTLIQMGSITLWRIMDTMMIVFLTQQLDVLFNKEKNILLTLCVMGCCFIYPFSHMGSAGWMATTYSYLWPIAFFVYTVNGLMKILKKESMRWYEYVFLIFSYLYAVDHQQSAVVMALFTITLLGVLIWKKKVTLGFIVLPVLTVGRLLIHMTWGGSENRISSEVANWFPDYNMMSVFDKLQIGLSTTAHRMFLENGMIFVIMGIVLAIVVFEKYEDAFHRIIVVIPNVLLLAWGPLRGIVSSCFPRLYAIDSGYSELYGYITNINVSVWFAYVMIFVMGVAVICIMTSVVSVYGWNEKGIIYGMLILMAIASRVVMGFSPTVYASGTRTGIYMYFCCIVLLIALVKEVKVKKRNWVIGAICIVGLLACCNNMMEAMYL